MRVTRVITNLTWAIATLTLLSSGRKQSSQTQLPDVKPTNQLEGCVKIANAWFGDSFELGAVMVIAAAQSQ